MIFTTQLFWAIDDTKWRSVMPRARRSTATIAPASSADSSQQVNPKVLLAEAIALQCAQNVQYISSPEFKRRVLGFSEGDTRNVHSYFTKLVNRLSPEEQKRLAAAHAESTGEKVVDPESVKRRVLDLRERLSQRGSLLSANAFYQSLFPGITTVKAPASFRDLYAAVRRALPDEAREVIDYVRSVATGLEPEKGGNVGVDVGEVLHRAEHLARQVVAQENTPFSTVGFQRETLGVDAAVSDDAVKHRFSSLLLGLPSDEKRRLELAQTQAVGAHKKAPTRIYDLGAMVERAKGVALDVATSGQPVSLLEFYQKALGYDTTNLDTLKVRASQYSGRLSPDAKKMFEDAKAVAIGKKPMTAAEAGQVFAPDAGQMEETAARARTLGAETFVPTTRLPEALPTPLQPMDPKIFQVPGLLADVMHIVKPLGFPVGAIDWKKFALPPSEGRLHAPVNSPADDTVAVDLPEDLPPPASLASTPVPRVILTPATVGILLAAGALVAIDGPFPFGDAAAASLVGGRLVLQ